jgi:glycogen debranching enzyme
LYHPYYGSSATERERALFNGIVWPSTITAYSRAYMNVYKYSGASFMERTLVGFEAEMDELTIGTLSEFYEPNPPYKGRGGMSSAPSVAAVISLIDTLRKYEREQREAEEKAAREAQEKEAQQ